VASEHEALSAGLRPDDHDFVMTRIETIFRNKADAADLMQPTAHFAFGNANRQYSLHACFTTG
jgi:hypothetical protein